MKILSVGAMSRVSNTSLHRHWALEKYSDSIDIIDSTIFSVSLFYKIANKLFNLGFPVRLPDEFNLNIRIKGFVSKNFYDIVWIDKGITVNKSTLEYIKSISPATKIVGFSPDNMAERHNQSQNYLDSIHLYDFTFTTKSFIVSDLMKMGAKNVNFVQKMYESKFHHHMSLTEYELESLGGDIGFIGAWEKERCESILFLVENGLNVVVYGDGNWNMYKNLYPNLKIKAGVFSEDYPKALQAFKITLCFLRKINNDQQTARTMEIPACGGFMLAERTNEHMSLFQEGKEADFFSSNQELLDKCNYYLANEKERLKIAKAGTLRCKISGYSNEDTIGKLIKIIQNFD